MSKSGIILNRARVEKEEIPPPLPSDPFSAIADLIEELQNRNSKLEARVGELELRIKAVRRKRVDHVRDPVTRQIVSSVIIEEE